MVAADTGRCIAAGTAANEDLAHLIGSWTLLN